MKTRLTVILLATAFVAPVAASARPTSPPRPRTVATHNHAPAVRIKTLAPHK